MSNTTILGTIDLGGDGKTILLDLINQVDSTNLLINQFVFSDPIVPTGNAPVRNTYIQLTPLANTGYYGTKTVWYNRIFIGDIGPITIPKGNAVYVSDLLPAINSTYGILLQSSDIVDAILPTTTIGGDVTITLVCSPSSYIFYGGTQITVAGTTTANYPVFQADTIVFGNSKPSYNVSTDNTIGNFNVGLVDTWSMSIDTDLQRKVFSTNFPTFNTLSANQISGIGSDHNTNYPFVYTWYNLNSKVRGITPLGEVIELSDQGNTWTSIGFITSNLDNNTLNATALATDTTYGNTLVSKAVFSATDGLYAILSNSSAPASRNLYYSSNGGNTWSLLSPNTSTPVFNSSENTILTYSDFTVKSGVVYLLSGNGTAPTYNGNTLALPVVEMYNHVLDTYNIVSLGSVNLRGTQFTISETVGATPATAEFVYDPTNINIPNVAIYGGSSQNNTPIVTLYEFSGTIQVPTVVGQIVNTNPLNREAISIPGNFVQAYSIPLQNYPNTVLDVIEITHPYSTTTFDLGFFNIFNEVPIDGTYLTFGQRVYTSVRSNGNRTPWLESSYPLGSRYIPNKVSFSTIGGTVVKAVSQAGYGIVSKGLSWNSGSYGYAASSYFFTNYNNVRDIQSVSTFGTTVSLSHFITEKSDGNYTYSGLPTLTENAKSPIGISLVGTDSVSNLNSWYVTAPGNVTPVLRTLATEYKFAGTSPILTVANDSILYIYTEKGNILASYTSGTSWIDYGVYGHIGNPAYGNTYTYGTSFGMSRAVLKPSNFIKGAIIAGVPNVQLVTNYSFNLFNNNVSGGLGFSTVGTAISSKIIQSVENTNSQYAVSPSSYNSLSITAPNGVTAWDVWNGKLEALTTNTNGTVNDSTFTLAAGITGTVVGIYFNVGFLNVDYAVITKTTSGPNTVFTFNTVYGNTVANYAMPNLTAVTANGVPPVVAFSVWDSAAITANYIPFVVVSGVHAYLVSIPSGSTFSLTPFTLTIPNNNSSGLQPLAMFNSNRLESYFIQYGNSVFRLIYTLNGSTPSLSLQQVVNISSLPSTFVIATGSEMHRREVFLNPELEASTTTLTVAGAKFIGNLTF